jgi:hypothetical protein
MIGRWRPVTLDKIHAESIRMACCCPTTKIIRLQGFIAIGYTYEDSENDVTKENLSILAGSIRYAYDLRR